MRHNYHLLIGILGLVFGAAVVAGAQDRPQPQPAPTPAPPKSGATTQPAVPASLPGATESKARMELTPQDFKFGDVWQGVPTQREFTIKNVGTDPLIISDVKSTCGCTVPTKPKSPVAPGESSTFTITYDTKKPGHASKKVIVTTNDPNSPSLDIVVEGNVKALFKMTPSEHIMMHDLEPSSEQSQTIRMECNYDTPLHLKLKPGQDFGKFDVELKEVEAGKVYELMAKTRPPLTLGFNRGTVVLETGLEKVPTLTVSLGANAQPRVLSMPPKLHVRPDAKVASQQIVRIQYRLDPGTKIKEVKCNLPNVTWEIMPEQAPPPQARVSTHQIRVNLPAWADLPPEGGLIEIFTDDKDPTYQRLEVPIVRTTDMPAPPPAATTQPKPMPPGVMQERAGGQ